MIGDPLIVPGPRRTSPRDVRPPAPAPAHRAVASPATQAPKVARGRARSTLAWLAAGLLLGALLAGTAARAEGSTVRRCPQWEPLMAAHGLPVATFSRIVHRESRCDPRAWNARSHDAGLAQLNRVIWRDQRPWVRALRASCGAPVQSAAFDPNVNLCLAAGLWRHEGLRPWL